MLNKVTITLTLHTTNVRSFRFRSYRDRSPSPVRGLRYHKKTINFSFKNEVPCRHSKAADAALSFHSCNQHVI